MRILITFTIGLLFFFYTGELLAVLRRKIIGGRGNILLNYSFLGLILIAAALILEVFANGSPVQILLATFLLGSGLGLLAHHLLSQRYILFQKSETEFAERHKQGFNRLFEILPGALTWLTITSPIWLSFTLPYAVAYMILLADLYWLFNAFKISALVLIGYKNMERARKTDWLKMLQADFSESWDKYYHFVEIHSYKEPLEVLKPAYDAVINSSYPAEKIFFGIGIEERADPKIIEQVREYVQKNSSKIGGIFFTIHPYGLPGELPGPASHRNWIIINAEKELQKRGIKPEQVLVTTLDADFVIHPQFLAGALHKYLHIPAKIRNKRSFTGAFLYYNNYWDCPAPMRLIASGTAFWQLSEMVGSDKYINFSSMSMNMRSLLDVGLWIPDKVNDDSGFYWKAYYHFNGDYKVIPHYLPISADTVLDVSLTKTFINQYKQLQRWAYGVEHMPFIIRQYFAQKDLDFWDKTDKLSFIIWSYTKWGTLALFITFAGAIVPLVNPHYSDSVVAYNLPVISSYVLTGAFVGLFSTIYVHEKTVPPRPKRWNLLEKLWSYVQWVLIPFILVTIASIPAIDAQTRLMLGKYLEYRTTNKARTT